MIHDQQKGTVQKRMEELEQEHHKYLKATENQQVACNALQASDQQSAQEIEEQMKKLRKIQVHGGDALGCCGCRGQIIPVLPSASV